MDLIIFLCQFCVYSGVSGEGSGVTVKGSLVAEPVVTPPAVDTKASIFLMIDISTVVLVSCLFCIVWLNYNGLLTFDWMDIVFQAAAAEDDDDDDVDLFGEETEEEKKAAEERAAAVKASGKKKECKFHCCHLPVIFELYPASSPDYSTLCGR